MADVDALRPGDEIRHRTYTEYRARVVEVGPRIAAVLTSPPEQAGDQASLDRGDVAALWEGIPGETGD